MFVFVETKYCHVVLLHRFDALGRKYTWTNCWGKGWNFQGLMALMFSLSCSLNWNCFSQWINAWFLSFLLSFVFLNHFFLLEWCSGLYCTTTWRSNECSWTEGLTTGCELNFSLQTSIICYIGVVSFKP